MTFTSNERRAQRRQQCREALANHIYQRLGLVVPPGRVRLQPSAEDGYAWSSSKAKEYLLKTNLGRGTVGLYQDIMDELGQSLEAVTPKTLHANKVGEDAPSTRESPEIDSESFTATIQRLEQQNKELIGKIGELQRSEQERRAKLRHLEEELERHKSYLEKSEAELLRARGGITEALVVLQKWQSGGETV
ncbi:uncharacterized protein N7496_006054 [Penicillium cataractarum]|uniref:Uncharacterized protein n=1 Tax=Penicillium cataractarum TaxID=2100454 RepID=A0A9W9S1H6_9EURO|nr:uncharacterized protein N7496_006054 [Penicillium cataractarum]KAJ5369962.1 hypothetical protein N7496_006054 [Penicillium cataractarum]